TYVQELVCASAAGPGNQNVYAYVAVNSPGGANTVTATWAVGSSFRPLLIVEVGGVSAAPLDGKSQQDQASSANAGTDGMNSGNTAANTNAPVLLLGFGVNLFSSSAIAVGTGFTDQGVVWGISASTGRLESKYLTTKQVNAATFTRGATVESFTLALVFDELATSTIYQPFGGQAGFFINDLINQ
ncbi:MAG: hypothetical protein ACRETL_03850, partial [Gammaproteobacteria bacterium]